MRIIWVLNLVHPNGLLCDMVLNKVSLIQSIWWECEQLVEEEGLDYFVFVMKMKLGAPMVWESWDHEFTHFCIALFIHPVSWSSWNEHVDAQWEKSERTSVCLCRALGPKNWKYGGELLYFSPSFPIQCGVSVSYLPNGMGSKDRMCRRFYSSTWPLHGERLPTPNLISTSSPSHLTTASNTISNFGEWYYHVIFQSKRNVTFESNSNSDSFRRYFLLTTSSSSQQ